MTVFQRLHMPSLAGATAWLNSNPLGPGELRGHAVLVSFWTLTCINWLRQEPYVSAWSQEPVWRRRPTGHSWPRPRPVRERTVTITFLDAGAEAYAFTFG